MGEGLLAGFVGLLSSQMRQRSGKLSCQSCSSPPSHAPQVMASLSHVYGAWPCTFMLKEVD
eukprot:scaffold131801_cov17-Tisochrysis_lutea.AAC.2